SDLRTESVQIATPPKHVLRISQCSIEEATPKRCRSLSLCFHSNRHRRNMITNRPLEEKDIPMLEKALDQDTFEHCEAKNYTMDHARSVVYEDEKGPVGVLRYTKTL